MNCTDDDTPPEYALREDVLWRLIRHETDGLSWAPIGRVADILARAKEADSDARLLAGAQALLRAAKETLEYWESTGFAECAEGCDCIVESVRNAITKAEGR